MIYCRHGIIETSIIERDAYVNQLRCNFLDVRIAKKKKKGLRLVKKGLLTNRMGNNSINFLLPTPFDNWGSNGVIYFSPVKLLPVNTLEGHIRGSVMFN